MNAIIATIGHQQYLLKSAEQAEALLNILAKATLLEDEQTLDGKFKKVQSSNPRLTTLEIRITQEKIFTQSEFNALYVMREDNKKLISTPPIAE